MRATPRERRRPLAWVGNLHALALGVSACLMQSCGSPRNGTDVESPRSGGAEPERVNEYPTTIAVPREGNFMVDGDALGHAVPALRAWEQGATTPRATDAATISGFALQPGPLCFFRRELFLCHGGHTPEGDLVTYVTFAERQGFVAAFPFHVAERGVSSDELARVEALERRELSFDGMCIAQEVGLGGFCADGGESGPPGAQTLARCKASCSQQIGMPVRTITTFGIDDATRLAIRTVHDPELTRFVYDRLVAIEAVRWGEAIWREWNDLADMGPLATCTHDCPVVLRLVGEDLTSAAGFTLVYCKLPRIGPMWGAPMACQEVAYQDSAGRRSLRAITTVFRGGADGAPDLSCTCSANSPARIEARLAQPPFSLVVRSDRQPDWVTIAGVKDREPSQVFAPYRETTTVSVELGVLEGRSELEGLVSTAILLSRQNSALTSDYRGLRDAEQHAYLSELRKVLAGAGCRCVAADHE